MSTFSVTYNGIDIYKPGRNSMLLISPICTQEFGGAGSFDFTMPSNHVFYNDIKPMVGEMCVYEGDDLIWFGRPKTLKRNFSNSKIFHCEGAMSYLNDSVMGNYEATYQNTYEILNAIIQRHNSQMYDDTRKFRAAGGSEQAQDPKTVKFEYETGMEAVRKHILADRSQLVVWVKKDLRYETRQNVLGYDEVAFPMVNQSIMLSRNLLDFSMTNDFEDICTGILAIGGNDSDGDPITLPDIVWASSEIRAIYGNIVKKMVFSEAMSQEALQNAAETYLSQNQFEQGVMEVNGVDLHYINDFYEPFRVGQSVHCVSKPHFMDMYMPITKIVTHLDTGKKEITLGTKKKKTITKVVNKEEEAIMDIPVWTPPELDELPDMPEGSGTAYEHTRDYVAELKSELEAISGNSYTNLGFNEIDGLNTEIDSLTSMINNWDGTEASLTPINTALDNLSTAIDGTTSKKLNDKIAELEHGWTHQIDGVTAETGTVNFVTTTT